MQALEQKSESTNINRQDTAARAEQFYQAGQHLFSEAYGVTDNSDRTHDGLTLLQLRDLEKSPAITNDAKTAAKFIEQNFESLTALGGTGASSDKVTLQELQIFTKALDPASQLDPYTRMYQDGRANAADRAASKAFLWSLGLEAGVTWTALALDCSMGVVLGAGLGVPLAVVAAAGYWAYRSFKIGDGSSTNYYEQRRQEVNKSGAAGALSSFDFTK